MARPWRRSPLRLAATTVVAAAVAACLDPPCRVAGALPPARPPGAVDATPRPGWVLPPLLGSAPDATYGTPVRRVVTSSVNFPFASILRAGLQVEDPGGGYVMFYEADRDQSFHFKNMSVYERRSGLPWARPANTIGGMPHWRLGGGPPALAYYRGISPSSTSLELLTVDVASGAVASLARPAETALPHVSTGGPVMAVLKAVLPTAYLEHWEVTYPSRDGSRYVWWADRGADAVARGVVALDLTSTPPTLLGMLTAWPPARGRVLAARIAPSGGAVLVHFESAGVYVYDTALSVGRRIMATGLLTDDAADVMVASGSGHDTLVAVNDDEGAEDGGWVVAVDLITLNRSPLFPVPRDGGPRGGRPRVAVSGQAYDRPGWVVLSADACDDAARGDWLCDKIVAMEVVTRRVVPLGTAHMCTDATLERRREMAHAAATPNVDLSRVYFVSSSGSCRGRRDLFELRTAGRLGDAAPGGGGGGGGRPRRSHCRYRRGPRRQRGHRQWHRRQRGGATLDHCQPPT
ncbi:hypothetical protein I4F81_008045 [Pyropia yezoensis]|uniref:Uncharacterized protein n=1 Tax=Pyropia yezoensis TaxID=2788 RepID=A0ACC3C5Y9_PYRYE|nr:hypothetical protein I4F81_008045 [Neopyropia yezoensis]